MSGRKPPCVLPSGLDLEAVRRVRLSQLDDRLPHHENPLGDLRVQLARLDKSLGNLRVQLAQLENSFGDLRVQLLQLENPLGDLRVQLLANGTKCRWEAPAARDRGPAPRPTRPRGPMRGAPRLGFSHPRLRERGSAAPQPGTGARTTGHRRSETRGPELGDRPLRLRAGWSEVGPPSMQLR